MRPLTLRQYERQECERFFAENPEIVLSRAEYDRNYPPGNRLAEWIDDTLAAARAGQVLTRVVLDDLFNRAEGAFWTLLRVAPYSLPGGYLNPRARRANEARERYRRRLA